MNRARLLGYATALSAMVGGGLIAPQPAQAQLLGSLIVTITPPADGSPVSGTIPVTASVTIIGALAVRGTVPVTASLMTIIEALTVRGVQFKLDGANLGAEDKSAPYSVSWNTTTASNGSHTLTAVATDILGMQRTSQPVTVTVSNDSPPTISSFTPTSGPVGTSVTISGTNFTGASAVLFNGTSASFAVNSATAITATVPAGATSGPISVTTADGTASSSGSFTVINPPTISSFTPSSGPVGTSVTISGTNFTGASAVLFNGTSTSFTVNSATTIQATVPAGATSGPISVTTADGTASSAASFTVINPPTISSFTPASGPVGTSVTISGTNFTGASAVLFNGTSASFTVNSATTITATVPTGSTSGPISVTTADGTASSAGSFTVGDTTPPSVTIDQAAGQADPTSSSPINFTAVFSKPVSGFTAAGVTISGTAGGTKTATVSGGPSTYNVAVSGMTSSGTVIASIPAGVASDAAGNLNTASSSTDNSVTFTFVSPVVLENQQPGSGNWQMWLRGIPPADDVNQQIKGYASATSVNLGESITFYVTVNPAQQYTMDVYRMGWYQGLGGRLMQSIPPLQGAAQPACPVDATTGLIECNWTPSYTLTVPTNWTSGVFMVQLTNAQGYQNYITFVVRDDARVADIMFQQAVATYQAYNNYPGDSATGKSLYDFNSYGANTVTGTPRAAKVSWNRPYTAQGTGQFFNWDYYFVRWLERSGYDVKYSTDVDTHENSERLLNNKVFLSGGHNGRGRGVLAGPVRGLAAERRRRPCVGRLQVPPLERSGAGSDDHHPVARSVPQPPGAAAHGSAVLRIDRYQRANRAVCRREQLELGVRRDGAGRRRQHSRDRRLRNRLVDVERSAPDLRRRHLPGVVAVSVHRFRRCNGDCELVDLPGTERRVGVRRRDGQLELGTGSRWRRRPAHPAHHGEPVAAVRCFPVTTGISTA